MRTIKFRALKAHDENKKEIPLSNPTQLYNLLISKK
jgi:hypothetical protein